MATPTLAQRDRWFWSIIDKSRFGWSGKMASGNQQRQQKALESILEEMPLPQVALFNRLLRRRMRDAYRWDVWGAVYVLAGGCSDDAFMDFRSWLVSMGKRAFDTVIKAPDQLWKVADLPGVESVFFTRFQHAASRVYGKRCGREIPIRLELAADVVDPRGKRWSSDDELRRKYPKLWDLYRD